MKRKRSLLLNMVLFMLAMPTLSWANPTLKEPDILEVVEVEEIKQYPGDAPPEFEGGINGLDAFLKENLTFPASAQKSNFGGNFEIRLKIDKEGEPSLINFTPGFRSMGGYKSKIVVVEGERNYEKSRPSDAEGLESLLGEVKRIISLMPKWTPGKKEAYVADTYFIILVKFKLIGDPSQNQDEELSEADKIFGQDLELIVRKFVRAGRVLH